jgi:hypothetical protein
MSHDTSALDAICTTLAADREALRVAVGRVAPALRGQRPAPDRWSVAEILEHLAMVEERSMALLAPRVADAPLREAEAVVVRMPEVRQAVVDRSRRVAAPEFITPTGSLDSEAAWAALTSSRSRLLDVMEEAKGRDLSTVTRAHPVLGQIDGYQWLSSIGAHEARHTAQIIEVAEQFAAADS